MRIVLYDADDRSHLADLKKQEYIGEAEFMMHELMRAKAQTLKLDLKNEKGKKTGAVILQAEQLKERLSSNIAILNIEGVGMKSHAGLFYRLLRSTETTFVPVYQSESIKGVKGGYKWRTVKIPTASLFRDDESKPLQIELYEYSSRGNHKLLGAHPFKFVSVLDTYKWDSPLGGIVFKNAEIQKRASFMDYIFGGCQISLAIAIDFTGSNGDPRTRSSLHYIDPATNQYMRAIHAVGSIVQEYDSDKNIPVFGFGAQVPGVSRVSHCFALNGSVFSPEVHGIDGVLAAYQKNLSKLGFSGPTNFAEIIRYMGDMAYWHVSNGLHGNYFVLLIMTDGQISDMNETIDEIVRCSTLPLSIIIVGVGNSDFSSMDRLDADINPLYSSKTNTYAVRDIVQFVPFNKYAQNPQELARKTLAEVPNQLVDYMTAMKIPPAFPNAPAGSFYSARQNAFLTKVGGHPENVAQLLQVGFPAEDVHSFTMALRSGYQNTLFCQTN
eukprot:TRINITY_DN1784_c0_g2_i1.p1 TRINITY_DN1784_c0_g2~~TRINITY_DN1784_c0_g2_i1.p1  ORF type:complete len:496 (-),score=36.33 TRINITY_DN1784_c0_g2_i1:4290-5777(-)